MYVSGIGRVIFWEGGSLWIGMAVAPIDSHAHHAIQLAVGISGPVEFKRRPSLPWQKYPAALIPSNLAHLFQAPGRQIAHLFVEPESQIGRRLLERFGAHDICGLDAAEAHSLAASLSDHLNAGADDQVLGECARRILAELAGSQPAERPIDPRVLAVIGEIVRRLDEPLTLAEMARVAGLSEGRFRHLFVAETGVAFRAYVLWARLNRALRLGFGGTSWTEAAHAANFADSAHLTRTCRRMMGITPTSLRLDQTVQADRLLA